MIYFVEKSRLDDLKKFCQKQNIYSCRIRCLLDSYGLNFDFVQFWLQYGKDKKITSAISKVDGNITVQITENSDIPELKEFFEVTGFTSVLSERCFFDNKKTVENIIMELKNPKEKTVFGLKTVINPDLKEFYNVLLKCQNKKFIVPKYEDFLIDVSHKVRHNTALCLGLQKNNSLVSVAMTVSQSKNTAIIGAVATDSNFRRLGYGGYTVIKLAELMGKRKIFIMRDKHENESFYKSLGFENVGNFIVSET